MIEKLKELWHWLAALFPATTDEEWEGQRAVDHFAASRRYRRERMIDEIFD